VDRYELAWAAGFFDGEGWCGLLHEEDRRTAQPHARVNQSGADGIPVALLRLQRALGVGRIGGPYKKVGRIDLYRWEVASRADVVTTLDLLSSHLGQVKLDQFTRTLEVEPRRSSDLESSDEWRSWAAGLYDGEGSTCLMDHRTHEAYKIAEANITQSSSSGEPQVLTRFMRIVGVGHVYGPYEQVDGNLPVYRWKSCIFIEIDQMLERVWPWLGPVKQAQATAVRDIMRSQPPLLRGRPIGATARPIASTAMNTRRPGSGRSFHAKAGRRHVTVTSVWCARASRPRHDVTRNEDRRPMTADHYPSPRRSTC
jgi:hypothetical protein